MNDELDPVLNQAAKNGNAALVKIFLQYGADTCPMYKPTQTFSSGVFFVDWVTARLFDFYVIHSQTVAKIQIALMITFSLLKLSRVFIQTSLPDKTVDNRQT